MPNTKAAKKDLRQAKKRAAINQQFKDAYKSAVKEVKKLYAEKKDVAEALKNAQQRIDKAAKRGVIKKNTASRKLSRLMKMVAKK